MIAKYEKTKKIIYLFLGGTTLGVGIYSYLGMRLIVPVLSLITLFYLRKDLKNMDNNDLIHKKSDDKWVLFGQGFSKAENLITKFS